MLFLAWRCLYAVVTQARLEDRRLKRLLLLVAYERFVKMLYGRINAHGRQWQIWVRRNQNTSKDKIIPIKHRHRTVIEQWVDGRYEIHKKLREELAEVSPSRPRALYKVSRTSIRCSGGADPDPNQPVTSMERTTHNRGLNRPMMEDIGKAA